MPRLDFTIHGEPVSKGRPRFAKDGGVYTPAVTKAAEEAIGWKFLQAFPGHELIDQPIAIILRFYMSGNRRCDTDNLSKLFLDSANMVIWTDDYLVWSIWAERHTDPSKPRTEITITY